ncbi:MAG: ParB/RepB/Spo0J family partition protein [Phycisphaerae bacterium]|nr:ParB/RepB/Spo0J family partition protein [Phycisphaerae bacterium]
MAEQVRLIDPRKVKRNPENPRLIFRQKELDALRESIAEQGILVPLAVYGGPRTFYLLDGERRWRCAIKLGLSSVPVIIQPKPGRLQNIMMMFAIHNARTDWDPLPAALKLQEIEKLFETRNGRMPKEAELAGLASLTRGEVRRLKKLLSLPQSEQQELLEELEKPASQQEITVDQVLEATKGAQALRKKGVVTSRQEVRLRRALIAKFRSGVIKNTVAPRKLARIARGVERGEVSLSTAQTVINKLMKTATYSIEDAFKQSVEQADFEHGLEQLATRLLTKLEEHERRGYKPSDDLMSLLRQIARRLNRYKR